MFVLTYCNQVPIEVWAGGAALGWREEVMGGGGAARGGRGWGALGRSIPGGGRKDFTWGGVDIGRSTAVFSSLVLRSNPVNQTNQANQAFGGFSWEPVPVCTLVTRLH